MTFKGRQKRFQSNRFAEVPRLVSLARDDRQKRADAEEES